MGVRAHFVLGLLIGADCGKNRCVYKQTLVVLQSREKVHM